MRSNSKVAMRFVGMRKIDGRSLNHQTLEQLRRAAVERVMGGERPRDVVTSLGFYRTSIYKWLRMHRREGVEGLRSRRAKGPTPRLGEEQRQQIKGWIIGRNPQQYGFDRRLWSRSIV